MLDVLWIVFYLIFVYTVSVNLARFICGPRAWWGERPWLWVPVSYLVAVVFVQLVRVACGRLPEVMP